MKIKIKLRAFSLGVIFLGLLAGACSTSKNYYIKPDFENQKTNSPIYILPVQQSWFNSHISHSFGYVSGKDKTAFNSLLYPLFSEHTSAQTSVYSPDSSLNGDSFRVSTLSVGEKEYEIILPSEMSLFENLKPNPRFLVILDQFYFRKQKQETASGGYAGHEPGSGGLLLYFETKYVFWDTVNQEPVAWGLADASVSVSETVSFPNYSEVMSKAIKKIIENGPVANS